MSLISNLSAQLKQYRTVPQKAGYYTHGILIHAGNLQVLSSEL